MKEKKIVLVLDPLALPLSALEKINTIRTLIKLEPSKENFIISGQVGGRGRVEKRRKVEKPENEWNGTVSMDGGEEAMENQKYQTTLTQVYTRWPSSANNVGQEGEKQR